MPRERLHQPSARLREAAREDGAGEAIIAAAHEIIGTTATRRSNAA